MAHNIQVGDWNIMSVYLSELGGDEYFISVSGGGVAIVQIVRGLEATDTGLLRIRITLRVGDSEVEYGMFQDMQNNAYLYTLVKDAFDGHIRHISVSRGSIVIELDAQTDFSIVSIVNSLRNGQFETMMRQILNQQNVSSLLTGKDLKVTVQIQIPKQLIEKEKEFVKRELAKVETLVNFDLEERNAKMESCRRMRAVGQEIEQTEQRIRTTRNVAAGVAVAGAALALFTLGTSLYFTGAAAGAAVGTIALSAAIFQALQDSAAQRSAQEAVDAYKKVLRDYRATILNANDVSEKLKSDALQLLEQIGDQNRKRLLKKYFSGQSSVKIYDDFRVEYDTFEEWYSRLILMTFFDHFFNVVKKPPGFVAGGIRNVAGQVESFNVLQEVI